MDNNCNIWQRAIGGLFLLLAIVLCAVPNLFAEGSQNDTFLVTFRVNGSVYRYEVAEKDTLVSMPDDPTPPADSPPFLGWFDGDKPFNPHTLITKNYVLDAKFSDSSFLATFMDTTGTILDVTEAPAGQPVPPPEDPLTLSVGQEFDYWVVDGETDPYDLSTPIDRNTTFAPILKGISYASFITNGPEIDTQVGPDGFCATEPSSSLMTRTGYIFNGWEDKDGNPFKFSGDPAGCTPIHGYTMIHAVWTPLKVGYTINFWNERAGISGDPGTDLANYELVTTKTYSATQSDYYAGSKVSIDASIIANRTNYAVNTTTMSPLDYSLFKWSDADIRPLSGNGDTIINVYAQRISYVFSFNLEAVSGSSTGLTDKRSTLTAPAPGDDAPRVYVGGTYTFEAKFEQNVSDSWPTSVALTNPNGSYVDYKFTTWQNYWANGARTISSADIQLMMGNGNTASVYNRVGRPSTSTALVQPSPYASQNTPGYAAVGYSESRWYYTEATADAVANASQIIPSNDPNQLKTPTENPTVIISHTADSVTRYYQYNQKGGITYQSGWNPGGWPGRAIPGFMQITAALTNKYQMVIATNATDMNNRVPVGDDGTRFGAVSYYMPRLSYNLNLITSNGTDKGTIDDSSFSPITNGYSKQVAFDQPIGDMIEAITPELNGYTFVGWYLDENFIRPYKPSEDYGNMPGLNFTLYAKYQGNEIRVTYYDEHKNELKENWYGPGEIIRYHDLSGTSYADYTIGEYVPGKGIFDGWFYQKTPDDPLVFFNLDVSLTNLNGYDLYAMWTEVNYTLTYMNDDGTGNYVQYGDTQTIHSDNNTVAKSGHILPVLDDTETLHFVGWNTKMDGSGDYFTAATPIDADTTVYAIWEEKDGATFAFYKLDENDNMLSGVKFNLNQCIYLESPDINNEADCYRNPGGTDLISADTDGKVAFSNLLTGTYILTETETKPGYQLPYGQWIIRVNWTSADNYDLSVESIPKDGSGNLPPAFSTNDDGDYTLHNYPQFVFPNTGGVGTVVFILTGLVLTSSGLMLLIKRNTVGGVP